ncbi:hypothetical protein CC80DRAFT_543263 [Byssothecium circinans]|uniref:Uncharacterized protein n=1 Tax=Byssothecium circinans TaxID=147558 RepID=A0A6A5UDT6_9PLEO|nr:hypothetical protein CC80DRAFT_543263 [Byssothecium circinans]
MSETVAFSPMVTQPCAGQSGPTHPPHHLPGVPVPFDSARLFTSQQHGSPKVESSAFRAAIDTNTTLLHAQQLNLVSPVAEVHQLDAAIMLLPEYVGLEMAKETAEVGFRIGANDHLLRKCPSPEADKDGSQYRYSLFKSYDARPYACELREFLTGDFLRFGAFAKDHIWTLEVAIEGDNEWLGAGYVKNMTALRHLHLKSEFRLLVKFTSAYIRTNVEHYQDGHAIKLATFP